MPVSAIPVTAAKVAQHAVPVEIEGLGTVQALNTATIRTQVQGTVESVDFVEGQEVNREQTLARIDPRMYQAQFDAATAALGRDQANLDNAKTNLNRDLPLLSHGYATPQAVDNEKAQVAQLENILKSDQAAIESARTQLSYATIAAPFDGITGIRLVDPGNVVHPTDQNGLVVITQVQPISVVFTLPSADIAQARQALAGGNGRVIAYAADDKTELDRGRLILIDNEADPATGTVRLKAQFPNAQRQLWPGTFVSIHLVTSVRPNGLTVPISAVQQGPQGPYVYRVAADGTATVQSVTIGPSRNGEVLIDSGLEAGQTVVVAGQYRLTDGAKVAIATGEQQQQVENATTASAGMLP
jgi:multidrug efflux system membrane fusion protein